VSHMQAPTTINLCIHMSIADIRRKILVLPQTKKYSQELPCNAWRILPRSLVGVISTRGPFPAIVSTPTVFSGFDCNRTRIHHMNSPVHGLLHVFISQNKTRCTRVLKPCIPNSRTSLKLKMWQQLLRTVATSLNTNQSQNFVSFAFTRDLCFGTAD
jgi:hypothetical protein